MKYLKGIGKKTNITFFFYVLLSLFLVIALLGKGDLVGAGESGIPFYSPKRMCEMSSMAWSDIFLGVRSELNLAGGPFYCILSSVNQLGVSTKVLQYIFFYFVFCSSLFSAHLLFGELFGKKNRMAQVSASVFYLFNAYSLMNVWNRFLINSIVFYSLFPLVLMIFIRGLKKEKYIYSLVFSVFTTIFSYGFGVPVLTLILWITIFFLAVYYAFGFGKYKYSIKYFFSALFSWLFLNSWWILLQVYYRFSAAFVENTGRFFSSSGNYVTFDVLSKDLGQMVNVLLLKHGKFFSVLNTGYPYSWPHFYTHPVSLAIQWIFLLLIFVFSIKKIRQKWVKFIFLLFLFGVFGVKGNSAPLGVIFNILFTKISLLQFFRNPFEKLGIILALSSSMLFGVAVMSLGEVVKVKKNIQYITNILLLSYPILFWGFPIWTGLVFTSSNVPANDPSIGYKVEVPDYYSEANEWLIDQEGIFRFITLPLGGEGIFNKWPKGYAGIEESAILFSTPSISYNTTVPFYSEISSSIEGLYLSQKNISDIMSMTNAKYLMFRPDMDHKLSGMRDEKLIEKILEEDDKLQLVKSFGPIKIYSPKDETSEKAFVASGAISIGDLVGLDGYFIGSGSKEDVLMFENLTDQLGRVVQEKAYVVAPKATFSIEGSELYKYSDEPTVLPYISRLPTSKLYFAIRLKEELVKMLKLNPDSKLEYKLTLLGKRLGEIKKLNDFSESEVIFESVDRYLIDFENIKNSIITQSSNSNFRSSVWRIEHLKTVFGTHLNILEDLVKSSLNEDQKREKFLATYNTVRSIANNLMVFPRYNLVDGENLHNVGRKVYQFEIKKDGEYEFVFGKSEDFGGFLYRENVTIQIDNRVDERSVDTSSDGLISFGKFYLDSGLHEVSFNLSEQKNLVSADSEFIMESSNGVSEYTFPISDFKSSQDYSIGFDYYIRSGDAPIIAFVQDTDKIIEGKVQHNFERFIPKDDYWFDFREYKTRFSSDKHADSGSLVFKVKPWNNCLDLLGYKPTLCEDPQISSTFDRNTEVVVKDLSIVRSSLTNPYLRTNNLIDKELETAKPDIQLRKINPTKYYLSVSEANEPFIMVFSETFDGDWKIYRKGESETVFETWGKPSLFDENHFMVNEYANAWFIDEAGDYELVIEYWPQKLLYVASFISIISFIATGFIIYYLRIRK